MTEKKLSRRDLLKAGAATALGFTIIPRHVLGGPGYTPPSEQLTKAVIGVGGMGQHHLGLSDSRCLAICDVDRNHLNAVLAAGKANGHTDLRAYTDWREVLERPDIDIV